MRMRTLPLIAASVVLMITAHQAIASGSAPMTPASKEDRAITSYNDGIRYRESAVKMEKELATTTDPAKQENLRAKIQKKYEAAARAQSDAVAINPSLYQALGELGYATRKLGHYPEALAFYDQALKLQPGYAEAIEYRAEAYLKLNRVADAKEAYLTLFEGGDLPRAAMLGAAMTKWVEQHKADPAGVAPADVETLGKWIGQRKEITAVAGSPAGSW